MKKLLTLSTLLLVFLIPTSIFADCEITITNLDMEGKLIYRLYHVDHPYQDVYPWPFNIAGGELKSGGSHSLSEPYLPGEYFIEWHPCENQEKQLMEFFIWDHDVEIILGISIADGEAIMKLHDL